MKTPFLVFFFVLLLCQNLFSQKKTNSTNDGFTIYRDNDNLYFVRRPDGELLNKQKYGFCQFYLNADNTLKYIGFTNSSEQNLYKRYQGLMLPSGEVLIPEGQMDFTPSKSKEQREIIKWIHPAKCGVIDEMQNVVIPLEYEDIKFFYSAYIHEEKYLGYLVQKNEKWGLINLKKELIIPIEYDHIDYYVNDRILTTKNNKWGVWNFSEGKMIENIYDHIHPAEEDLYIVKSNGNSGIINKAGKEVLPLEYDEIVSAGIGINTYIITSKGKKGLINNSLDMLLPVKYDSVWTRSNFNWQKPVYYIKDKGLVGKFEAGSILEPEFSYLGTFDFSPLRSVYIAQKNNKYGVIESNGEEVLAFSFDSVSNFNTDSAIKLKLDDKWGVIDYKTRKNIVPFEYTKLEAVPSNYYIGWTKDSTLLWNNNSEIVFSTKYKDNLEPKELYLSENDRVLKFVDFQEGGLWGRMDLAGKVQIKPAFKHIYIDTGANGREKVSINGKYGLCDSLGNILVPAIYDEIEYSSNEQYAICKLKDGYGIVNYKNGKTSAFKYTKIIEWRDIAITRDVRGKAGLINSDGKELLENGYDEIILSFGAPYNVSKDGKWAYIGKNGKFLTSFDFDIDISFYKNICPVLSGGLYGLIDSSGNYLLKPKYKEMENLGDNFFRVRQDGKWGVIDNNGNEIIELAYELIEKNINNFSNKYLLVFNELFQASLFDKKGNLIVKNSRGSIFPMEDFYLMDNEGGKSVLNYKHEKIPLPFSSNFESVDYINSLLKLSAERGYALYSLKSMKMLTDHKYMDIFNFKDGIAICVVNNKYGLIDTFGKEIVPPIYDYINDSSPFSTGGAIFENERGTLSKTGVFAKTKN